MFRNHMFAADAQERIAELNARIAALTEARNSLARLARDCGDGSKGPCPIIAASKR
jgi:MerR family transcriptional regulator, mercuric resistance operon regulatory protein